MQHNCCRPLKFEFVVIAHSFLLGNLRFKCKFLKNVKTIMHKFRVKQTHEKWRRKHMIIIAKYEDCMWHLQGTKYGELLNKVRFNM